MKIIEQPHKTGQFVDWVIPDPKHMEPAAFNEVRDFIEGKVKALLQELK